MGCNFCDDCSDCTVGYGLGCSAWDDAEHDSETVAYATRFEDQFPYDDDGPQDNDMLDSDHKNERFVCEDETGMGVDEMYCVSCGESVQKGWKVCPECGTPIPKLLCEHCGKKLKRKWSYCPYCGCIAGAQEPAWAHSEQTPMNANTDGQSQKTPSISSSVYDDDIPF